MSNAPASAQTTPDRFAPLDLWRAAGAVLELICQLFGGPEKIAAQHALTRKAHKLIASWLRCAEAMVRRLLAIEAASYAPAPTPHRARAPRTRVRKEMSFSVDAPEHWRVAFRCFVGAKRAPRPKPAHAGEEAGVLSAWPLAERLEALIRAYNEHAVAAWRPHFSSA